MKHSKLHCMALLAFLLVLAGCQGAGQPSTAERALAAQLVVRQATLRYIEAADDPADRAAAVHGAIDRVLAYADADETTLAALEASARALVPWDELSLADRDLLDVLISAISARLAERIGDGALDPDDRVAVVEVLQWVQAAARLSMRIA